jgi:hypothetical protein
MSLRCGACSPAFTYSRRERSGYGMSNGGPIGSSDRLQSAAELRDLATRARRFLSWLAPLGPSRPKLLAYVDELCGPSNGHPGQLRGH